MINFIVLHRSLTDGYLENNQLQLCMLKPGTTPDTGHYGHYYITYIV